MRDSKRELFSLAGEIGAYFRFLAESGCAGFDCSEQSLDTLKSWGTAPEPPPDSLETVKRELFDCQRCGLCKSRKTVVFGTGNPKARLLFVGDAPGGEEDIRGEPFIGPPGQLLTKIIQAIKLDRNQVYICNVVKCRPPGNRRPSHREIRTCKPFLERQIAAVKPDFICALGEIAAQTLLDSDLPITNLRGRFHDYKGIKLMPTFHPGYLLKNQGRKRETWEDMKKLMKEYGR